MTKRGRHVEVYHTTWGEAIAGLTRTKDGRWRDAATSKRFTEPDERLAVARFRAAQDRQDDRPIRISRDEPFDTVAAFHAALRLPVPC